MAENVRGRRWLRRLAAWWLAWTAAGLFFFTQDLGPRVVRNDPAPWSEIFVGWMAAIYVCAAFTPLILWLGRRFPIEPRRWGRMAALHFLFASAFSVVELVAEVPVLIALGVFGPRATFGGVFQVLLLIGFHGNILRYAIILGGQAAVRAYRTVQEREREALELRARSSELAAQLTGAQLSALKMQLHPHFLFNTLGAVAVLIRKGEAAQAETMLTRLSDLLRAALEEVEAQETPLWRELEFLRQYLAIEQVRFQDRLRVRISAGAEVSNAMLPHMALQPIVENAVRHGLGRSEGAVTIEVDAARAGGELVVTVRDDGPGFGQHGGDGKGIGLRNTGNRLKQLYGEAASLHVEHREPHGVAVRIAVPFRLDEGAHEDPDRG